MITVTKALSQTSGPSPNAGPITVTLSYTNSGTAAATNLQVTDALPAGMTYNAGSGRWSVSGASEIPGLPKREPNRATKYSTSAGRSSRHILSGGSVIVITLRR